MNAQLRELVQRIDKHVADGVFPAARKELEKGLERFPESIELQLLRHRIAVRQKKYEAAAEYLLEIQKKYPLHELFLQYLQELGNAVLHNCQTEHLIFYRNAPRSAQKQLLISAAVSLERAGEYLPACRLHSISLSQFPELIPTYGPRSIDIALTGEEKNKPLPTVNGFRSTIVDSILPTIFSWKVRVRGLGANCSEAEGNPEVVHITKEQFYLWLEIMQGYYLSNMEFTKLHELFIMVVKQCGILSIPSDDSVVSTPDRFFSYINSYPNALPSEVATRFYIGYFIQLAIDYYIINSDRQSTDESSASIIIPLISLSILDLGNIAKRPKISDSSTLNPFGNAGIVRSVDRTDSEVYEFLKHATAVYNRGKYESDKFEEELENSIPRMGLPFVVENAALFIRGDIATFEGLPSIAVPLYRDLNLRLKEAWQTQKYIMNKVNSTQSTDHNLVLDMGKVDLSILKSRCSPIFPFRLLFSIGLCYLTESKFNEAVTEFFAIVGAMPFNSLDRTDVRHCKNGLKTIYPEALGALCLEYIVQGIEQEIYQQGPRDTTISCLLVLSQFLSTDRNKKIEMIYDMILKRGRFEFPDFFRYVFDTDFLYMISRLSGVVNLELNGKIGDREIRPILNAHINNVSTMQHNWRTILVEYCRTYYRFLVNASGTAPSFI
ncbi:hypothetical protein K493DRAFT_316196 [Basidiobolus meristosporus CBS 931.73]|uniref:Integrator complex subunit 10 n=1 Tax=Basidiobolus meristosporus CBS 931.73 TaxID=1314790 RepID=A0A1Y1Y553_9FUNG|nr:hypothetical protein K493DRAFT_316196 [Basidiobolus meristosporus CBS 931.73]|eukprot:ORX93079.1 hypothetical protein K493DRAFT_316196 [Basidiobolus meristosporus CBS 931.73]